MTKYYRFHLNLKYKKILCVKGLIAMPRCALQTNIRFRSIWGCYVWKYFHGSMKLRRTKVSRRDGRCEKGMSWSQWKYWRGCDWMLFVSSPFVEGFICFVCSDGGSRRMWFFQMLLSVLEKGNYIHRRGLFQS